MNTAPPTKGRAQPFRMPIDDARSITGRGTLVTGKIEQGVVKRDDPVKIAGAGAKPRSSVVTLVEMSGKAVDHAKAGDTVGVLLSGIRREDVASGQVLQAP
jgi:elongation factor Tu